MKRARLNGHSAIAEAVGSSLQEYLDKLDGEPADNLYDLVIGSVEKSLISDILQRTKGNQSEAASMLGINRNTLRAKLDKHKIKLPQN
ncbi:MAG: Fis family transcriptional regulator [Burkholderiales bacterium]|nr:Fis family transcriptional regulator [Burkholderiales bacterium]